MNTGEAAVELRKLERDIYTRIKAFQLRTGLIVAHVELVPGIHPAKMFRAQDVASCIDVGVCAILNPKDAPDD